jgi:hypothetical protein
MVLEEVNWMSFDNWDAVEKTGPLVAVNNVPLRRPPQAKDVLCGGYEYWRGRIPGARQSFRGPTFTYPGPPRRRNLWTGK